MENVCRTCLRIPENLTPLYTDLVLMDKIEKIASIQLLSGENYPSNICHDCVKNVNTLYNFRKIIIHNDKELRECDKTLERLKLEEPASMDQEETEREIKTELGAEDVNENIETEATVELPVESTVYENLSCKIAKCELCNLSFPSKFKLYKHKRKAHVPTGMCNVCGMIVRTDNLKRHVMLHRATPVPCEICGKVFKNSESLRSHKLIHKGMSFSCEECSRSFKVKSEYKRHLKTHIDPEIQKAVCTVCGKKVRDLKRHVNSHTGERPYSCKFCDKGFSSPYALKVHTRQHTNERPYECSYCPMAFPQKVSLVTHLKSKHSIQ